ncbi:MAG TPA: glutamate--tRNA ligase [Candidatus Bathyarchaeia archaeon]|nr:glutamate--tRNA ligase [Candidatus Bathyarchaeia archaeon]
MRGTMEDLREEIRKYALQNAVRYGKSPKKDVVLKRMLAEHPDLRKDAKNLSTAVQEEIKRIESLNKKYQEEALMKIAPELMAEINVKRSGERAEIGLPELPHAKGEHVVMRFAPNPNGAATLGSARGIIINSEYARMYDGKFILRFDDTDPVLKRPLLDAYDWYLEDCTWLDAGPDEVIVASERIDLYYKYAEELLKKGAAYVCFCPAETFKQYKDHKLPCPHRTASVEENIEYWEKMLSGVYEEKEAVLRIKTDIESPDPALRDWVAFRVLKRDHPRPQVGEKYMVWPMLDFESAIEDHLLGLTHIIRGKDLMKSEKRQRFLYDHLGWDYPRTMLWGKIKMHEFGKFSTSELRKAIERGEYEGWDDPQLPTLRALRRRGFKPEAIRKFFISMGVTRNDIAVSMKNLYAENRKMVDAEARRYFFVRNPVEMRLPEVDSLVARALKHPGREEYREIETGNTVYLSDADFAKLKAGLKVRLKYLCTVEVVSTEPLVARVVDRATEPTTEMPVIQWAPTKGIKVVVKRPDGIEEGIGEPLIATELGNVVQFERYGFVRIDSVEEKETGTEVAAYFTH